MISLRPITRDEARAAIFAWHRHHAPRTAWRMGVGAEVDGELAAVAMIGNPTAPEYQKDPRILEVTRVAIAPGHRSSQLSSRLYGACWRSTRALGVHLLVTYTRLDEDGTSLIASSWVPMAVAPVRNSSDGGGTRALRWLPGLLPPATEPVSRVRWCPRSCTGGADPATVEVLCVTHPTRSETYRGLLIPVKDDIYRRIEEGEK